MGVRAWMAPTGRFGVLVWVALAACNRSIAPDVDRPPATRGPAPQLSDDDLAAILTSSVGPAEYDQPARTIGYRGAVPVRMKVLCGDVCPHQSARFLDLAVDADECERSGGAFVQTLHPDIWPRCDPRCVPRALLDRTIRCVFDDAGARPVGVAPSLKPNIDWGPADVLAWRSDAEAARPPGSTPKSAAIFIVDREAAKLGIDDPRSELAFAAETYDRHGFRCVVLEQVVDGVSVFGALVVVRFAPSGAILLSSSYEKGAEGAPTIPALGPDEAVARVQADLRERYPQIGAARLSAPALHLLPAGWRNAMAPGADARAPAMSLVWRVPVTFDSPEGSIATDWVVDAQTAALVASQYAWFGRDRVGSDDRLRPPGDVDASD